MPVFSRSLYKKLLMPVSLYSTETLVIWAVEKELLEFFFCGRSFAKSMVLFFNGKKGHRKSHDLKPEITIVKLINIQQMSKK